MNESCVTRAEFPVIKKDVKRKKQYLFSSSPNSNFYRGLCITTSLWLAWWRTYYPVTSYSVFTVLKIGTLFSLFFLTGMHRGIPKTCQVFSCYLRYFLKYSNQGFGRYFTHQINVLKARIKLVVI
jgi:hypothetical protein